MRISDWSSDVCSSDLGRLGGTFPDLVHWGNDSPRGFRPAMKAIGEGFADGEAVEATEECEKVERRTVCCHCAEAAAALRRTASRRRRPVDRKSVVQGKRE